MTEILIKEEAENFLLFFIRLTPSIKKFSKIEHSLNFMVMMRTNFLIGRENMVERNSATKNHSRRQTQWEGLFVSEHAWDPDNDTINDSQPMLSANEQQAILDMLIVACDRSL